MSGQRTVSRLRLLGIAVVGATAAHSLIYRLLLPDHAERVSALAATGHGLRTLVLTGAILLGAFSAAANLAERFRSGLLGRRADGERGGFTAVARRLALLQVGLFLAQETVERLAIGAPLGGAFRDELLLIGIPIQVIVAFAVAALLLLTGRIAEAVGRALATQGPPRESTSPVRPLVSTIHRQRLVSSPSRIRAPPLGS